MLDKTKAAMRGRQCHYQKLKQSQDTRVNAGGQSLTSPGITGVDNLLKGKQSVKLRLVSPEISGTAALAQLGCTALQHTLYLNRCRGCEPVAHTLLLRSPVLVGSNIGYQLFGSMPRCCNSLRIILLIQAARDSSPSCCWACSISSRNSGSSLNWNGGLPRLSFLCVDTSITPDVMCLCVMTHYIHVLQIATPRSAGTLPRRLTKPLDEVTTMAELQSTQTHPKYTWLFLGIPKGQTCTPVVIRTTADTEEEARAWYPRWELTFAAKIRSECPLYQHINGAYELTITGLEVRHD